jgi:hypothetical protein
MILVAAAFAGRATVGFAAKTPEPPQGGAATTTLALIQFNQRTCDQIAGRILDFWQGRAGSVESQEEAARDFVLARQLSDLAASRAAGDLLRKFQQQVRNESGKEVGAAMERLSVLVGSLCDAVALPTGTQGDFQKKIGDLTSRIDLEMTSLGRLMFVPERSVLEASLEPYLVSIQTAGIAAAGEYQHYLESLRPKERKVTFLDAMNGWHREVYLPAVTPVKDALARYLQARQALDYRTANSTCRELVAKVIPLLRDPNAFKAPDTSIEEPLRRAYQDMRQMAAECTAGNSREVETKLAAMQENLGKANTILAQYGLRP